MKNKIIICGRGYSYKYYKKFISNNYKLKFGYNYDLAKHNFDFYFFSKSKEKLYDNARNILKESHIEKQYNEKSIKIGTTTFGLFQLLTLINDKYPTHIVDLVGFDFRYIYEHENISIGDNLQSLINVESQKIFSPKLKDFFKNIIIQIISFDEFSDVDPKTGCKINKINNTVELVAEITTNHFGNFDRLKSLILGAKKAGANSIKLQKRNVETFYSKQKLNEKYKSPFGTTFRDYRNALELSEKQILNINKFCKEIDIGCFYSVLDIHSFKQILNLNHKRIKLPSTISNHKDYINYVFNNFSHEIVVSTGMTNQSYVDYILDQKKNYKKLYLLHCISSYPVNILNSNLKVISKYSNLGKNIIPGYSSHDIGYLGSMFAVFSGAKMIEKHIKFGNTKYGHFDETALDVNVEFPEFVKQVRNAETINGDGEKSILDCEHHKY